ncbi:MAG: efflux RND transporter periplasmic adaptor subunit [Proteobacteria bacterium]|nr:efflux RND transporter periplasmic adaptor subunit [Pseudomonadota bacterium]
MTADNLRAASLTALFLAGALAASTRRSRHWPVLLVALLLASCSVPAPPQTPRSIPVRIAVATAGPAAPLIATNGVIANKDEARLSFKVSGVIRAIYVEPGAQVHAGQRLAEIEPGEINAQLDQARALSDKALRDLARGERLHADQVISLEQLQDLRTQAATARALLKGVEFNRGYAVITAAGDGVVLRKLVQERELVPAGTPVLVVGTRGRGFVVRAALADRELVLLQRGDPVELRLDAYPGRTLRGELTEVAGAADESTGMFPVEVRVADPPPGLASGMVAKLRLQPAAARAATLTHVPVSAVVEGDGERAAVFVIDGEHARRREVRVAFIDTDSVGLSAGLAPGERVVTEGALYLDDNDRVEIVAGTGRVAGLAGR